MVCPIVLHAIFPWFPRSDVFAEIYGAYEKKEPWLGYMWGTADPALKADLDLVRLEEAPYTQECWDADQNCALLEIHLWWLQFTRASRPGHRM